MNKLLRIFKHRWLDASDTARAVPDDMAERITALGGTAEGTLQAVAGRSKLPVCSSSAPPSRPPRRSMVA